VGQRDRAFTSNTARKRLGEQPAIRHPRDLHVSGRAFARTSATLASAAALTKLERLRLHRSRLEQIERRIRHRRLPHLTKVLEHRV
jgi:hypothetical protein